MRVLLAALLLIVGCGDDDDEPVDSGSQSDAADEDAEDTDIYGSICGNGELDPGEICDDSNERSGDGCSDDCKSDESCGNGMIDRDVDEVCDDSNTTNGDGCAADCKSDETCGNSVIDLGVSEVCDDGNNEDGDGCSADCSTGPVCGDESIHPPEQCDDGNDESGDGCSADCSSDETCGNGVRDPDEGCDDHNMASGDLCSASCTVEVCGNGVIDSGEDCDDQNADPADGCTNECAYSCAAASDCADDDPCNGEEDCVDHACTPGTPEDDGASCGTDRTCRGGSCVATSCGDGSVTPPEECDDDNGTNGDGCENDCTFSCESDADCGDGNPCNGAEACTAHRCVAGTSPATGSLCDRDASAATRDICRAGACVRSFCGDGYHDTTVEACEDGNMMAGDGCENDCTPTGAVGPTAFRMETMRIVDPHFYTNIIICADITGRVNGILQDNIDDYTLSYLMTFRPLDTAAASGPADFVDGVCLDGTPASCSVDTGTSYPMNAVNVALGGACLSADDAVLDSGYTPLPNDVSGPCFQTDEEEVYLEMGGARIHLTDARISATYAGGVPPNQLIAGLVVGFLSTADAKATIIPMETEFVGGKSIYSILADNRATGSSCSRRDDSDTNDGVEGFWMHVNFTGSEVDWTGP